MSNSRVKKSRDFGVELEGLGLTRFRFKRTRDLGLKKTEDEVRVYNSEGEGCVFVWDVGVGGGFCENLL